MNPDKLSTIFLTGDSSKKVLLQCAVFWAELGKTVWFISPKAFNTLPKIWTEPPTKNVLKLILFIYLPETSDLLIRLNEIHMSPNLPKVIIIMDIEHYWCIDKNEFAVESANNAAFVTANLMDSVTNYIAKYDEEGFLIAASNNSGNYKKIKTILELYFSKNLFNTDTEDCDIFNKIVELFNNKNISI